MGDSTHILGLHDSGGAYIFREAGKSGWIVFTHELGHDPTHLGGFDYTPWADMGVIARLNNGYAPNGTIPAPDHYAGFVVRVGNWVKASRGCHIWVLGNEMQKDNEQPPDWYTSPEDYAALLRRYERQRDEGRTV